MSGVPSPTAGMARGASSDSEMSEAPSPTAGMAPGASDDSETTEAPSRMAGMVPGSSSDSEIVALISAAVHAPFAAAWRGYGTDVWLSIRRALEEAAAAHQRALAAMTGEGAEDAPDALAQYRDAVSDEVIEPLRAALAGRTPASALEESLASTARRARVSAAELPAILGVPVAQASVARLPGVGPVRAIKRAVARVFGPVVWRGRVRRVPVARLARQHLDQVVMRALANAFRRSQHDRAEWLGRLERAWAEWAAAVLRSAPSASELPSPVEPVAGEGRPDDTRVHGAAGRALQAELLALIDEVEGASADAWSADSSRLEELLAASVAVAGTFAADPPSSRPSAGRQRMLAVQWDAWAQGAPARLELYRSLVAMRRGIDGLFGKLRGRWSRAVRNADAVLAEVAAELNQGRERAARLSVAVEDLAPILEAERQRTDAALARIQGVLPEPDALFEALTNTVEEAVQELDDLRERMPGALALHDIPVPGDPPRKPTADLRAVRLRETFLYAFDLLRKERIRTAPSAIREAMHRIRSDVADLREVSGYGYEAAAAEASDRLDPDAPHPTVLVVDALVRAGNKASAARELLREALAAAERGVAAQVGSGSRQLIEQATADRMTGGYLEARAVLAAGVGRGWKRIRRVSAQAGARAAAAVSWAAGLLRPLGASVGLGPASRTVVDRREHSLAYADEYPRGLPVVYRRLFSLDPLADARLLAGREDALAAVATAWDRRATGEAKSLVVIASPGAGVTSFLNVVTSRLTEEAPDGVRRRFTTRVRTEARLAGCLARWLGLGDAGDLDSFADRVLEAPPGSVPGFAILEATEHLHMRAPGGAGLFERLLTFMSRTESSVFWIVAMTSSAWQLVEKRAPAFVHDVERVTLGELSPEALRQAVLARHRLSGLPLRFAEPHDRGAALWRRARRLRGADRQEQLIEADFFQRLHRLSQGSPRLALFHWLRSADFVTAKGSLLVQPLSTLDAGVEGLDGTQGFALKAILDHGTLTSDEYREIARTSGPESLHILRSLEECRVIEEVSDAGLESPSGDAPPRTPRYRIRPLMIGAVAAHLRARNILH